MPRPVRTLQERFDDKYMPEPMSGCWLWIGAADKDGYGLIFSGGLMRLATRVSLELNGDPVPDGICALHRCDNPPCVNPDHLFHGTNADNTKDMVAKGRMNRNGKRPLTPAQVQEIRKLWEDKVNRKTISEIYMITVRHVSNIVNRKKWKHI